MRAAIRILAQERRWLSQALALAETELQAGTDLITESRLREQIRTLGAELTQVIEALGVLRGAQANQGSADRRALGRAGG